MGINESQFVLKIWYDGSFFTINQEYLDKLIIFFGGTAQEPDGLPNHRIMQ